MSKPPMWVLPRPRVRPRARTLYAPASFSFTTLHHGYIDGPGLPPLPSHSSGRAPGTGAVNARFQSSPTSSQQAGPSQLSQSQPDGLSPFYTDAPGFQAQAPGSSPSSSQPFSPSPLQVSQYPQPPPTPPLQNPAPVHAGPRSLPLPPTSSSLPASIAAFPPMSYYNQLLSSIPSGGVAPFPSKKTRAAFSLESAAYGIPKQRQRTLSPAPAASTSFVASSMHRAPAAEVDLNLSVQVGEDAYFLLPNALGVSDGVGGWAHRARGIDSPIPTSGGPSASALFSRRLMHFCADEISALNPLPEIWSSPGQSEVPTASTVLHAPVTVPSQASLLSATAPKAAQEQHNTDLLEPVAVLQRAYTRAVALSRADHTLCGSSTALLAILLGDELRVAHLGDCALCLIRDGQMVYRSEEQQWKFNHPLQLGPSSSTVPGDAQSISLKVETDDILILSSDGLSDNLWDEDVLDEVNKFTSQADDAALGPASSTIRKHAIPSLLSEALCSRAKRASEKRPRHPVRTTAVDTAQDASLEGAPDMFDEVPFARRAREEGIKFSGGKADDISVLVAVISARDDKASADDSSASAKGSAFSWAASAPPAFAKAAPSLNSNLTFFTAWSSQ
ncbi:protein serine/threonine phosphatase 2C [Auricularia subglabra TFB-10046 SS5]|nr:protein serine/threonine phosphatase 2C [Auricularia subglabra TFB-10046 SS5]